MSRNEVKRCEVVSDMKKYGGVSCDVNGLFGETRLDPKVYFLFNDDVLVYVGKSKGILNRVIQQCNNKNLKWNSLLYVNCKGENYSDLEMKLIKKYQPMGNRDGIPSGEWMLSFYRWLTKSDCEAGRLVRSIQAKVADFPDSGSGSNVKTIYEYLCRRGIKQECFRSAFKNYIDYIFDWKNT